MPGKKTAKGKGPSRAGGKKAAPGKVKEAPGAAPQPPVKTEKPSPQESPQKPEAQKPETQKQAAEQPAAPAKPSWDMKTLLFNRWDTSGVEVEDPGLRNHINITPFVVPRSEGKYGHYEFYKRRMNIVERFINKLMVSGHRGKKHKLSSGRQVGKTQMLYSQMKEAFVIIEKRTKKNPVQVLVKAVENSALLEEVASYRLGGIIARNSVITSPQRRLDLALRHLTQGIHRSSFRNRKSLSEVIADELIAASENDPKSFAILERNRIEKEAEGAR